MVTNGATRVGRAICLRLATRGTVGIIDPDLDAAKETADLVTRAGGYGVPLSADLTSAEAIAAAVERLRAEVVDINIAVACTAGAPRRRTILDAPDDWDSVMDASAKSVYLTARSVFPLFLERGAGSFVAVASDAGIVGAQGLAVYAAAQHAVVGLVRSLAAEFGEHRIRSNVVCPGLIAPPSSAPQHGRVEPDEEQPDYPNMVPMGRVATGEEVAEVVEYLALPEASYTTGSVYVLDGGVSAAFHSGR